MSRENPKTNFPLSISISFQLPYFLLHLFLFFLLFLPRVFLQHNNSFLYPIAFQLEIYKQGIPLSTKHDIYLFSVTASKNTSRRFTNILILNFIWNRNILYCPLLNSNSPFDIFQVFIHQDLRVYSKLNLKGPYYKQENLVNIKIAS